MKDKLNATLLEKKLTAKGNIATQNFVDAMREDDCENAAAISVLLASLERRRRYRRGGVKSDAVVSNKQVDSLEQMIYAVGKCRVRKVTIASD